MIVSIPPFASVAQAIGGEHAWVESLTPAGYDPHSYEPTPSQLRLVGQAALFISTGLLEVEEIYTDTLTDANKELTVVTVTKGMALIEVGTAEHDHHDDHDHDHHHHHHGPHDPHIWLSPARMKQVASHIAAALSKVDAAHAADYAANLEAFNEQVDALDAELRDALADAAARPYVTYHGSFAYFAEEYGLQQMVIEQDGNEPTPTQLANLIEEARAAKVAIVLMDEIHSMEAAASVADAIGAKVHTVPTLSPDWMANLRALASTLAGHTE